MNNVSLTGRLVRNPEVRYSQGENPTGVARYTLAVSRPFKSNNGGQDADFISCVAFGKSAEFAEKYMKQGMMFAVTGRIQTGSYDGKDGKKVYTTDVVVATQEFCEKKGDVPAAWNTAKPAKSAPAADGFMNIPDGVDDELPFN